MYVARGAGSRERRGGVSRRTRLRGRFPRRRQRGLVQARLRLRVVRSRIRLFGRREHAAFHRGRGLRRRRAPGRRRRRSRHPGVLSLHKRLRRQRLHDAYFFVRRDQRGRQERSRRRRGRRRATARVSRGAARHRGDRRLRRSTATARSTSSGAIGTTARCTCTRTTARRGAGPGRSFFARTRVLRSWDAVCARRRRGVVHGAPRRRRLGVHALRRRRGRRRRRRRGPARRRARRQCGELVPERRQPIVPEARGRHRGQRRGVRRGGRRRRRLGRRPALRVATPRGTRPRGRWRASARLAETPTGRSGARLFYMLPKRRRPRRRAETRHVLVSA